jgi:hypothetical protein
MRRVMVLASVMVALLLAVTTVNAAAGWTKPVMVYDGNYKDPSMVVGAHGHVHVAARGDSGIWYLTNSSGTWTRTRLTKDIDPGTDREQAAMFPSIAIDPSNGQITVAYSRGIYNDGYVAITWRTLAHGVWSAPQDVPHSSGADRISLAVRKGRLAIAAEINPNSRPPSVKFFTMVGGTWTSEAFTSGIEDRPSSSAPSLALDADGRPRIAYVRAGSQEWRQGGASVELWYARGTTRSGGFVKAKVAPSGKSYPAQRVSLALTADGSPRIGWSAPKGAFYTYRNATGWHTQQVKKGTATDVHLILDGKGHPRLALSFEGAGVWYATRSGGAWRALQLAKDVSQPGSGTNTFVGLGAGPSETDVVYVRGVWNVGFRVWYTCTR